MNIPAVLLAEDEPVIAYEISYMLEQKGYRVISACSAGEIIALCDRFRPDFAILNFRMKGGSNGLELAHQLKAQFAVRSMLVTGTSSDELAGSPFFKEPSEILYKPFTPGRFRAGMEKLRVP